MGVYVAAIGFLKNFTIFKLQDLLPSGDEFLLQLCLPLIGKMWRKPEQLKKPTVT